MTKYKKWVKTLESFKSPIEQASFIYESLKDKKHLDIFGRFFFPRIIQGQEEPPQCHLDLIQEINNRQDSAIIFPRGHSKSTWIKIDTIHDVVYSLEPVILYISATITDASFHFESIKSELENNDLLISIYGFLIPHDYVQGKKWTNKHFETTNGVNVVARGAGKGRGVNIKNQRPTKIIIDDAEEDKQVKSPDRRQQLHDWIYNVIIPSKDQKRGFIKMIGTVLHPYCEVLKFYNQHGGIFRKALEDDKPIWPAMFSKEKLDKLKNDMGSRGFSQEYLNNPVNEDTAIIKPSWIKKYTTIQNKSQIQKVIAVDPQAGESKTADYYGITVLGYFRGQPWRYVLESIKGRKSQLEQAAEIVKAWQRHPETRTVGVEKVMTQVAVYQLISQWKIGKLDLPGVDNNNRNIPIRAIEPEGKDKVARLQVHEAAFERGEIFFHESMTELELNVINFPDVEHDDLCFVKGTLVNTPSGQIPIEKLKIGDYVLTPFGKAKIEATSKRKDRVIKYKNLIGTPNHPVFIHKKGFTRMDSILYDDKVDYYSFTNILSWRIKRLFISIILNIDLWERESITYLNQQQTTVGKGLRDYMLQFGSTTMVKKFQKVFKFIIKMGIHLIITLVTYTWWKLKNIYQNILKKDGKIMNTERKSSNILIKSGKKRKNGMDLQRGWIGIKNIMKTVWQKPKYAIINVKSVAKIIKTQGLIRQYVPIDATLDEEEKRGLTMRQEFVSTVLKNSSATNIQNLKPAQENVEPVFVFNIKTSHGVYYANNILVSNCDSLVYALSLSYTNDLVSQDNANYTERGYLGNVKKLQF